jgi:uncharacterized damage-inducible protein DinB
MFSKSQFNTLFAYHWHTTSHLLSLAEQLSDEDCRENPGYGHGSIHDLLFHILRTDYGWRMGLETGAQQPPLRPGDFPTFEALKTGFDLEHQAYQALLDGWSAEEIEGNYDMTNHRGKTYNMSRWRVLQHLILHGMQHHTEIAHLLTLKGKSPGDIDFIFFE